MGVKGLTLLMEDTYKNVRKVVEIRQLVEEHRVQTMESPILVVDGATFAVNTYGDLDWASGGQWSEFSGRIDKFVNKFQAMGVKLVFIFDGAISSDKQETWINRRNDGVKRIERMFVNLLHVSTTERHRRETIRNEKTYVFNRGHFAAWYLRYKWSCDVFYSFEDTDKEIAAFAAKSDACFAIMSSDTDFLIFDSKQFISMKCLDLENMTTTLYDKTTLLNYLEFPNEDYLPLYASLMGNDVMRVDALKRFHAWIGSYVWHSYSVRSKAVANLVLDLKKSAPQELALLLFGDESEATTVEKSLDSYIIPNTSITYDLYRDDAPFRDLGPTWMRRYIWNKVSTHCRKGLLAPEVYTVLKSKEFRACETVEYFRMPNFLSSGSAFKRVRQRAYYVLFRHLVKLTPGDVPNVEIQEWIAESGNQIKSGRLVKPIKLNQLASVPELDVIMFGKKEDMKLNIFLSLLDISLTWRRTLLTLPMSVRFFMCLAKYIFGLPRFRTETTMKKALLAQVVKQNKWQFKEQIVPVCNVEAIHFGGFIASALHYGSFAYSVCGRPYHNAGFMDLCFDGKCFNFFFVKLDEGQVIEDFLDKDELRFFAELVNVCEQG